MLLRYIELWLNSGSHLDVLLNNITDVTPSASQHSRLLKRRLFNEEDVGRYQKLSPDLITVQRHINSSSIHVITRAARGAADKRTRQVTEAAGVLPLKE